MVLPIVSLRFQPPVPTAEATSGHLKPPKIKFCEAETRPRVDVVVAPLDAARVFAARKPPPREGRFPFLLNGCRYSGGAVLFHALPIWKSATRQVGKPAQRRRNSNSVMRSRSAGETGLRPGTGNGGHVDIPNPPHSAPFFSVKKVALGGGLQAGAKRVGSRTSIKSRVCRWSGRD